MAGIFHYFPINASIDKVFDAISTPNGLDKWLTKTSSGKVANGNTFHLCFEPDYYWTAVVSKCIPDKKFEITIQNSDDDWKGSKVGFRLANKENITEVQFFPHGLERRKRPLSDFKLLLGNVFKNTKTTS